MVNSHKQRSKIGCKISNSCFQALPAKEGESLGMRVALSHNNLYCMGEPRVKKIGLGMGLQNSVLL